MTSHDPHDTWWMRVFAAKRAGKRPTQNPTQPAPLPWPRGTALKLPAQRTEPPF